jgi:signal transduction histidine kinase
MRALDDDYRTFFGLVATQIASGLADARALEEERRRAEALAVLDRAKTTFFSNVSHEFRTPLTLMISPLEELLAGGAAALPADALATLDVSHRNSLRLLKLVNTLLDFSRIEAGRIDAIYEPTDLAAATAELASVFRSAIEKAGLRLVIDCPPLPEAVHVDRDMWEKIVLNLLSNALKFTLDGDIAGARHRQRHLGIRAAARLRALPSREELARPNARRYGHRPRARAGARAASRRIRGCREPRRSRQHVHGEHSDGDFAPAAGANRGCPSAGIDEHRREPVRRRSAALAARRRRIDRA